jgi:tRNA A37 methylthiotransferase MiaB
LTPNYVRVVFEDAENRIGNLVRVEIKAAYPEYVAGKLV